MNDPLEGIDIDTHMSAQIVHSVAEESLRTMRRVVYVLVGIILVLVAVGLTIIIAQGHSAAVVIARDHVASVKADKVLTNFAKTLLNACTGKSPKP